MAANNAATSEVRTPLPAATIAPKPVPPHDRRVDWIDAANHRRTIAPIAFGGQTFLLDRGACGCAFFGRQQARAYRGS
jgi:hypothetical protein